MAYGHAAFIVVISSILFAILASSAHPTCHPYYGRPNLLECLAIFDGPIRPDPTGFGGIRSLDRKKHLFQLAGEARPRDINGDPVTNTQWNNRASVPMFWSKRKYFDSNLLVES